MPFAISRWLSDNRVRQGAARKDDAMTTHDRGGVRAALGAAAVLLALLYA